MQGAPTAPQLSIPLALYCDRRSRGGRLLPLLQPLPFQMSPPILELYMGKRPSSCHSFLAQTKSALLSSRIQHGAIYHMRKRYPPLAEATRGVECVPRHQGLDPRALTCTGSKLELEQSTGRKHSSTSSRAEALTTHLTWQETDTAGGILRDTEALKRFIAKGLQVTWGRSMVLFWLRLLYSSPSSSSS